jgi:pimeloyl-ACP methyl ester carboxylesterase
MPALSASDGRRLAYESRGSGELLVCHPGGPGFSGASFGDLGGLDRSRTLLLLDPRGAGASEPPASAAAYSLEDYVADLEALRVHARLERMDLLGHSHGSLVSIVYSARYPARVRRLVLVGTGARFHAEQAEAMHASMAKRSAEPWFLDASQALAAEQEGRFQDDAELGRLVAREMPFYFASYGANERAFVERALEQPVHAAALKHFNEHEFLHFDLRPLLGRVVAPTLVVGGSEDFILGPEPCREVADGIAGAGLELLEDVGHMPWVERPEEFRALVEGFLAE